MADEAYLALLRNINTSNASFERQSDARANASGSPDARGNVSDLAGTVGTGHRNIERLA
jgi:hypothetical protein